MEKQIRTRFAPSPTGFMHVGGVRTALFAWLIAKQNNGAFLLRLEDTDKAREVEGSAAHIIESLKWIGIDWQEGVDIGGPLGPYKQSERLENYKRWAQILIEKGRAYADPYTKEQVEEFRQKSTSAKKAFLYRDYRPENPPIWDGSQPLRFKSDPKPYKWTDAVMGELSTGPDAIDDFVLIKSDGYPTYNFCHIIDDLEMKISHILRSQEFISSVPKFLNLYEALEIERPIMATLPYVMALDGKKKLGKRDGAKDVLDYRNEGYLPEAMMNFLASMGWNDGTEQEIFTRDELITKFSLDRVQRSGARFDEKRLLWMNGMHIRMLTLDDLYSRVESFWPESAKSADESYKKKVLSLVHDRLKTLCDLPVLTDYFFTEPTPDWAMISENNQLSKLTKDEIHSLLTIAKEAFAKSQFDPESLQNALNQLLETTSQKPAILFSLIRFAVSWAPFSPALNDTLATLGPEKVANRIQKAIQSI